jgi:hypothetical protein
VSRLLAAGVVVLLPLLLSPLPLPLRVRASPFGLLYAAGPASSISIACVMRVADDDDNNKKKRPDDAAAQKRSPGRAFFGDCVRGVVGSMRV